MEVDVRCGPTLYSKKLSTTQYLIDLRTIHQDGDQHIKADTIA